MIADPYDLIVFDLDGTLVDSLDDLAESVRQVLAGLGLPAPAREDVRRYVGHGARRLIERSLGETADSGLVARALALFLEHYDSHCTDRTRLYRGAEETLRRLRPRALAVLTNKPEAMSRKILDRLGVLPLLDDVIGGDSLVDPEGRPLKKPDPMGLRVLMERHGVPPGRTLLVGDTRVDLETAERAGVRAAGVTFGFRPEEILESPPDHLLDSLPELVEERRPRAPPDRRDPAAP